MRVGPRTTTSAILFHTRSDYAGFWANLDSTGNLSIGQISYKLTHYRNQYHQNEMFGPVLGKTDPSRYILSQSIYRVDLNTLTFEK